MKRNRLFFTGEHLLDSCEYGHKISWRKDEFLKMKGICFGCLCTGPINRDCKKRNICTICHLKRTSPLHISSSDKKNTLHNEQESRPTVGSALVLHQSSGLTGLTG